MREARRLCAVTEAQLQTLQAQQGAATRQAALFGGAEGAEPRGRPAGAAAAGSHNLSHLRQVVERYILMDDGEETDALFQALFVVFTYHALLCTHPVRSRYICTQCAQNVCKEAVLALLGLLYTQSTHTQHTHAAVYQVIATFLQFDAATVRELQAARQRKAAAQRGLIGRASLLFSQR